MVSQVNNYTLDYYNSFYVGTPSIKNGKLSKIGDIKIDYHERYNMGSPYIYNGKILKLVISILNTNKLQRLDYHL